MHDPSYYRDMADRARRLARSTTTRDVEDVMLQTAHDYDDLAEDLETGAVKVRHPELMPQEKS